ncbi:hypothetical protein Aph01nite_73790 [Acrocarpospora phusangensis]|uniref:Uncharacterized protein n=1 Tax=Acrocarpospora phusangensis TaxID=1070424 RepID=A0A919QHB0_9ACTN|nr:hypothetical protein [Acrocarpospora phusangensis]GIH29069.1 hypothetical protein Aph01nite_73790 [Acrocarpospora phusangensis]
MIPLCLALLAGAGIALAILSRLLYRRGRADIAAMAAPLAVFYLFWFARALQVALAAG